jgi:2-oxoglutarate dehydrogenase E2 component (dihydrolipoamide succinyltransferase)
VEVGTRLAVIAPSGAPAAPVEAPPAPPAPTPTPTPTPTPAQAEAPTPPPAEAPAPSAPLPVSQPPNGEAGVDGRFVSPVVARIAGEHGVDVSRVPGTGRGGRVTKKDILAFVESGAAAKPVEEAAPPPPAPPPLAEPVQPAAAPAPEPVPVAAQAGEALEPMTAMRRGIAEHMRRSLDTSAHVTSAIEVDMSRVAAIREKLKREYQEAYGVNPTYLAFVARAAVDTLRDYPYVNGEIRGEQIVTRNYVNLGIAVELADGKGLIVPVIRSSESLNLLGMARAIADLAERAREKKLLPDDVQGGTFTITNPGGYGTFHGTPIISQPQAAILGTYAVVKRPWVVQDELGDDVIAIRSIMTATLTYDHRLVDGALAGRFLRDLRTRLESWGETDY